MINTNTSLKTSASSNQHVHMVKPSIRCSACILCPHTVKGKKTIAIVNYHAKRCLICSKREAFSLLPVMSVLVVQVLRGIDGFARAIGCAAPSMDPLIAHLPIDHAIINRSHTTALVQSIDSIYIHAWCETTSVANGFIHYNFIIRWIRISRRA